MIRLHLKQSPVVLSVNRSTPLSLSVSKAKVVTVSSDGTLYEGPYAVEPVFKKQVLPTKNKTMAADLTVNAIRVERVDNAYGTTVYIGTKGD